MSGPLPEAPGGPRRTRLALPFGLGPAETVLAVLAALTLLRLLVLVLGPYDLYPDEAQYWSWAQEFAFGYFSKPPMIAWVIAATTGLFGDGEWAVRLAAPLFHAATAFILFLLGKRLYDARVGVWSAVTYATLPAVSLSSGLISTDVPLLFFWALALLALGRLLETRALADGLLLGLAVGLGLLSKYAMLYLPAGIALLALFDPRVRARGLVLPGLAAVAVAGLLFLPNVLWNMSHDFSTVSHTAANANWTGELFNPEALGKFFGDQFGVFGPVLFGVLIIGLVQLARRRLPGGAAERQADTFLLCFALPVLAIVLTQAFISRANANWGAAAYVPASVLVVAWLLRPAMWRWLMPASLGLHLAAMLLLYTLILSPGLADDLGRANDFKRVRGWAELGTLVETTAQIETATSPYTAVLTDDRLVHSELLYYAPAPGAPLVIWDANSVPENHFELTSPFRPALGGHVLYVTAKETPSPRILAAFQETRLIERRVIRLGPGKTRVVHLFALTGYAGPAG